jgi:N-methylhydantoinase B
MRVDPVLLEVMYHKLKATTEEMGIALGRSARSSYVKEANDFGTGLCNGSGKLFAFPLTTGTSGGVDLDCSELLRAESDLTPGDVLVTNHPYMAGGLGSHLPDINLLKPYFHEDQIVCFGWTFVHASDVGGGVPSSISPGFDTLFQEGLQIPPMKLVSQGRINDPFMRFFRANSRVPDINEGDLKAQLAALTVGERRVAEIIAHHGVTTFIHAAEDLVEYARLRALDVQRRIPDGDYVFWDYMDDDFRSRIPVRLRCRMVVRDGHIHLDLTGTDPQVASAYNVPTGGVRHPWFTTKLMHLLCTYDPELPINYGLFENISVTVPKGTVMNPEAPAAVGVRHATAIRFSDALLGCLALACPGIAPAPSGGTVIPAVVSQVDLRSLRRTVMVVQSLVGGAGAGLGMDGADGRDRSLSNIQNTPTERGEADARIRIERYAMRCDSGGPGEFRGGTGIIYAIRVLQDGTQLLGRGLERFVFRPWGVAGGLPGMSARVLLHQAGADERELGKIDLIRAREGDLVTIMTAGGGGYGHPYRRDVARVSRDVRLGYVSRAAAASAYGVIIDADTGTVDAAATQAARGSACGPLPDFGFDPSRALWDSVFDDVSMSALAQTLLCVPAAIRSELRERLFETVAPGISTRGLDVLSFAGFDKALARQRFAEAVAALQQRWSNVTDRACGPAD